MSQTELINGDEGIIKPGQIIQPEVSIADAKKLINEHFGFEVKRITELNSYDDRNFLVEAPVTVAEGGYEGPSRKFVFKVLNSMDSKKQHVEAENAAMILLRSREFGCPFPEPSVHQGSTCPLVKLPGKSDVDSKSPDIVENLHVIRLLSFVEGQILGEIKPTEKILYDMGVYTGELLEKLKDFKHHGLDNHRSMWLLCSTPLLDQFLYVIQSEPCKFKMVSEVLESFSKRVIPAYPKLQKGIIHGDLNEQNIIVKKANPNFENNFVKTSTIIDSSFAGVIDFADLQDNFYVFELAILLAYMMLECLKTDIDPLEGSGHVLAGFMSKREVLPIELGILRICICSRLCQSLVLGRYTYTLAPTNEYLLTTAKTGWAVLDRLWNQTTNEQLYSIWKKIVPDLPLVEF